MTDTTNGTADPVELRHLAEAWPEDIFPTPPEERQAKDAAAAHVLRRMAVPHFLACADEIDRLQERVVTLEGALKRIARPGDYCLYVIDSVETARQALLGPEVQP